MSDDNIDLKDAAKLNLHIEAALLGRAGGKAGTGKSKARTSEQARAASMARWSKYRERIMEEGK